MTDDLDLVGSEEAARIAGITPRAIRQHHHRGRMPAPIPIAGSDVLVWTRDAIERWAAARPGRGRPREVTTQTVNIRDEHGAPVDITDWGEPYDPTGNADLSVEDASSGSINARITHGAPSFEVRFPDRWVATIYPRWVPDP